MSAIPPAHRIRFARRALAALALVAGVAGCANKPDAAALYKHERYAAIVASTDRSAADRTNDVRRKPVQMLEFIGVRQGSVALDLSAGGGYTTELLARTVHPGGRVYAQVPRAASPGLTARLAKPTLVGVTLVVQPFETPVPAEVANGGVDLVTIMFNYHDLGHMGVDRERMNRAVFAALRPGGLYVVADHSGRAGTGISESGTLHRVEEAFVRAEVERAGFRLVASADFLRNPGDPRDRETPEPAQPKDEFVLKFVKP
jgi:predicted methyltransferase